ncbi:4227_t:CDS:2, partial [Acaulospora colombiana]
MGSGGIVIDSIIASEYLVYAASNNYTIAYANTTTTLHPKNYVKDSQFWDIRAIAFAILTIVTLYHVFSSWLAKWINMALAFVKLITLLLISFIGLVKIKENPNRLSWNILFSGTPGWSNFGNYCHAMLQVLFSYAGWNNLNYSLGEMDNPSYRLKISNPFSVIIVSMLSIIDPQDGYDGVFKEVMSAKLGDAIHLGRFVSVLVAFSSIGAVGAMVWSGARVLASAAK